MNENENKYLSLKTAAQSYGYTRDHLGLMIRQGKLKGIKLGSYYVTTSDWIMDYLKHHADPNHHATTGKFSNKFLTQVFAAKENTTSHDNAKKPKNPPTGDSQKGDKISQASVQNKIKENFFSEIQEELLPSLREIALGKREMPAIQEKTGAPSASSALQHIISGNPYIILPIRQMEESERESILGKIADCDKPKNESETA